MRHRVPTDPFADAPETLVAPASDESPEARGARRRVREALFGDGPRARMVDRFTLLQPIGEGGMGTVFAAYDPKLDRRIAIKLLRPHGGPGFSDVQRRRMIAEARAMAKVSHPNVVGVFEVGEIEEDGDTLVFVAMEFVEGCTLREWLRRRPTWREVVDVYAAAGRGLAAVHRAGLVHRDFKPDNAMIDADGRVRVMDFGLARGVATEPESIDAPPTESAPRSNRLTHTGAIVGTPAYMAPEQIEGVTVDARSDQYAFCVALHEALWGKRPFGGRTPAELLEQVIGSAGPPEPPRSPAPARMRTAVMRGLARRPEDRFPSMDALLQALAPSLLPRRIAVWLGLGVGAAGVAWGLVAASTDPCGDDSAIADVWSPATAEGTREAFLATGVPYAEDAAVGAGAAIDRWAAAWVEERRRACEATRIHGTQSEARMDRRMRCLERRRREARALVELFRDPDATVVENALVAVGRLVPPARCDDDAFLDAAGEPPADPEMARAVDALRDELADAQALHDAGRYGDAMAAADDLRPRADAIGFAPLDAEIAVLHARSRSGVGDLERAEVQLREAYLRARAARLPEQAAAAAMELALLTSTGKAEPEWARLWWDLAGSEIDANGLEHLEPLRRATEAEIAFSAGDLSAAIELADRSLAAIEAACEGVCDGVADGHLTVARVLTALARYDEAEAHARQGLELELELHGPDHPHVASARMQLGDTLMQLGRVTDAKVEFDAALAARRMTHARVHPDLIQAQVAAASVLVELERYDEAIVQLEEPAAAAREAGLPHWIAFTQNQLALTYDWAGRLDDAAEAYATAIAAMEQQFPEGHPNLAVLISNHAAVQWRRGRKDDALEGHRRALAIRRTTVTGPDPRVANFLHNLADTLLRLGRADEAIPLLREGVAVTEDGTLTRFALGLRLNLGRALWERDREGALAVVREVEARCHAMREEQRAQAGCDEIAAWRAEHGDVR